MLKLLIVFIFFIVLDISGHLLLKCKRGIPGCVLLSFTVICTIAIAVMVFRDAPEDDSTYKENIYIVYKYLLEGYPEEAAAVLGETGSGNSPELQFFNAAAEVMQKNYIQGYFLLERAADSGAASTEEKRYINELKGLCDGEINSYNEAGSYEELVKDLEDVSYNGGNAAGGILDGFIDAMGYSSGEKEKYQDSYEADCMFTTGDIDGITYETINNLEDKYGPTQRVLQYKCKYYVQMGDFEAAKETAKRLVDEYNTTDNHIIFTDIIAQEIYQSGVLSEDYYRQYNDAVDEEYGDSGSGYGVMPDGIYKASVMAAVFGGSNIHDDGGNNENSDDGSRFYNNNDSSNDDSSNDDSNGLMTEEKAKETLKRAINYIRAKKGGKDDDTGMYDLQMAKLYLVAGDKEEAGICLERLIANSVNIKESSKIKKSVEEVVTLYNQIKGNETDTRLDNAVRKLIEIQSSGIVPAVGDTINSSFDTYVSNTLKYDKISVFISKIDTSAYPDIRAYVNINGTKDDKQGLASDFSKNDFTLEDTQYGIDDFNLIQDKDSSNVSIGLVLDCSGSMQGIPVENAKKAAAEVVSGIDAETQKIAVVSYNSNATLEHGLDNDKESIYNAIYNMDASGGTNIPAGIMEGISAIKDSAGTKALILMSDGQDQGSADDMEYALRTAKEENITIFAVGFGDCNTAYMENIADSTGGIFIAASGSEDLSYIYLMLQRYIINNYCIEYTVKENADTDPRYLRVRIEEYAAEDTKDYWLNEENSTENTGLGYDPDKEEEELLETEEVEDGSITITSFSPGDVSIHSLEQGVTVIIGGRGFEDGMSVYIGGRLLSNISVRDENSVTGMLKGTFSEGEYSITARKASGEKAELAGFTVFKGGTVTKAKLGNCIITADSITQVMTGRYVAYGNVLLNGFVHCGGSLNITSNDITGILQPSLTDTVNIGQEGTISSTGKLYVNYPAGTELDDSFTNIAMQGKDYIIQRLPWTGNVTSSGVEFDNSKYTTLGIEIPNIVNIDLADINLKSNSLEISVKSAKMDSLLAKINKVLKEDGKDNKKEEVQLEKTKYNSFGFGGFKWDLKLTCTASGLFFGGSVKADVNDSIRFDTFGINSLDIKLDSLDKNRKYWEISGSFDFSKLINIKEGAGTGFDGSISSYYWMPDTVSLGLNMEPGIPVYEVLEINRLEGGVEGISTIAVNLYNAVSSLVKENVEDRGKETGFKAVILSLGMEGKVNLFAATGVSKVPVIKKLGELGKLGDIDASASLQFYNPFKLSARAELELLGQKTSAGISIGQDGFNASGNVDIKNIKLLCVTLGGSGKVSVWAQPKSIGIESRLNGNIKVKIPGETWSGVSGSASAGTEIKLEYIYDEKKLSLEVSSDLNGRKETRKFWYNGDGDIFLINRFHYERY